MDFTTHQLAKGVIDEPVTRQRRFSAKTFRDDEQAVVATAASGAGVTSVLRRVVDQFDASWLEDRQTLAQRRLKFRPALGNDGLRHVGMVCLNGLTLTLSYTPAAT